MNATASLCDKRNTVMDDSNNLICRDAFLKLQKNIHVKLKKKYIKNNLNDVFLSYFGLRIMQTNPFIPEKCNPPFVSLRKKAFRRSYNHLLVAIRSFLCLQRDRTRAFISDIIKKRLRTVEF